MKSVINTEHKYTEKIEKIFIIDKESDLINAIITVRTIKPKLVDPIIELAQNILEHGTNGRLIVHPEKEIIEIEYSRPEEATSAYQEFTRRQKVLEADKNYRPHNPRKGGWGLLILIINGWKANKDGNKIIYYKTIDHDNLIC